MTLIKRYPNRKLYDTQAKQYITLEGVAELIRQGEEITVIDHASGEDLTTLTLTQIIVEQEKKQGGRLPRSILSSMIQVGGDRLSALQRTIASSFNFWRQFDEEIRHRLQDLVRRGELSEREAQGLQERILDLNPLSNRGPEISEAEIEQILIKRQVPTYQDLQRLQDEIEILSSKLDELAE